MSILMPLTVEIFICFVLSSVLLFRYADFVNQNIITTVAVFISWFISFMVIFILPADISSTAYRQCLNDQSKQCILPWNYVPEPVLPRLWRIIYWTSQLLTWIILPLMQSYCMAGDFSSLARLKSSIKANLIYYSSLGVIFLTLLVYVMINNGLNFAKLKVIAITSSNTWGLLLLVILLGYGIVARINAEKCEAEERLDDVLEEIHQAHCAIGETGTHPLRRCLDKIISKCPPDWKRRSVSFRRQIVPNSNPAIDYLNLDTLIKLHQRVIQAVHIHRQTSCRWTEVIHEAIEEEDIVYNQTETMLASVRMFQRSIHHKMPTTLMGTLSSNLRTPRVEWYWKCMIRVWLLKIVGALTVVLSVAAIWSEFTFFIYSPTLSVFAIMINSAESSQSYFFMEMTSIISIGYLALCAFFTVFRMRIFNVYYLASNQQTDEYSILFSGMLLCRLTAPLCLNYLCLIHKDSHIIHELSHVETAFTGIMGHLDLIPVVNNGLNILLPLCISGVCLALYFDMGTQILHRLGFEQFVPGDELTDNWIENGRELVKREKAKLLRTFYSSRSQSTDQTFSTDFDVHRNWLAITFNLPLNRWYFDDTSKWTLDYPPLFAWFEYALATIANIVDPGMLKLTSGTIRTYAAIIFQRTSVILSDTFYYFAIYELCYAMERANFWQIAHDRTIGSTGSASSEEEEDHQDELNILGGDVDEDEDDNRESGLNSRSRKLEVQSLVEALCNPNLSTSCAILMLLHPALLIVDHIHFQYNGFLSGFLIMSVSRIITKRYIEAGIWFAVLLNLKHIYLYCAPAYGIYILRKYCLGSQGRFTGLDFLLRLHLMALSVEVVYMFTFVPFMQAKSSLMPHTSPIPRGLLQIMHRIFPFKRGLCHAYWAPNFWSFYNTVDKFISVVIGKKASAQAVMTGGLVEDSSHQYMPTVTPLATFLVVAAVDIPIIAKLWKHSRDWNKDSTQLFLRALTLCAFTSFQFGYHVHEKAIILVLLPLIPLSFLNQKLAQSMMIISVAGTYSLFPLLYEPGEWPVKWLLLIIYHIYALKLLNSQLSARVDKGGCQKHKHIIDIPFCAYVIGMVTLEVYCAFLHGNTFNPLVALNKFEFLPLLMTSVYSALGIMYGYVLTYAEMIGHQPR
ncbi:G-protein coupled receptor-associated protein LMBRD2 [Fragariocoptes setiger]|uniref:G-protein coupled receptor-associated protein LMBRD2 n=1 Tax=Fragariocoptes setiger TaxID=1670756 RepID=A0ABQ7SBN6_9ACAR|nr:G-protein coupled receptor-associated protein LMBRD2 [Fragariocoptes setiger]